MLKNPPEGKLNKTKPNSWRWFQLMDEAMSGRLAGTAHILDPSLFEDREEGQPDLPRLGVGVMKESSSEMSVDDTRLPEGDAVPGDTRTPRDIQSPVGVWVLEEAEADGGDPIPIPNPTECVQALPTSESVMDNGPTSTLYATLLSDFTIASEGKYNKVSEVAQTSISTDKNITMETAELDRQIAELETERQALEREQDEIDREGLALERERQLLKREVVSVERERAGIDRDRAAIDRDRAALDRDRAALDRDRAALDRDRAALDRDREILDRDRAFLDRDRAALERERVGLEGGQAEMQADKEVILQTGFYQSWRAPDLDPDRLETRQRLVSLFHKFIQKL